MLSDKLIDIPNEIDELQDGLNQLSNGSNELTNGTEKLETGINKYTDYVGEATSGVNELYSGIKTATNGINQIMNEVEKSSNLLNSSVSNEMLDKLDNGANDLSDGVQEFEKAYKTAMKHLNIYNKTGSQTSLAIANKYLTALEEELPKMTDGAEQISNGVSQLTTGMKDVKSNTSILLSGLKELQSGFGNETENNTIINGIFRLNQGLNELNKNSTELKNGATDLKNGANELSNGIWIAKLGIDSQTDKTANEKLETLKGIAEYGAEPIKASTLYIQPVENYGSAFAPYFIGLSLWVGGIMIFFGIYLDYNRKIKSLSKASNKPLFRGLCFIGIGILQGILLSIVITYVLGIKVNNPALLFISTIITSLTFISIVQFCIMHLVDIGIFIALFLLILQLTSCGGTFPIETQSKFYQIISKFLPMTYSTQLFKEAISGTAGSYAMQNILILLNFMTLFILFTAIFIMLFESKKPKTTK